MTRKQQFISLVAGLIATACALTVVYYLDSSFAHKSELSLRNEVLEKAGSVRASLEQSLSKRLFLSSGLEAFVKVNPDVTREEFDQFAKDLGSSTTGIRSLQLAQDGKVSHVYPLKGNEAALGHDILNDPERRDAVLQAIGAKNIVLAGPVELRQGGTGLIGRVPIYLHRGDKAPTPRRGASFDEDGRQFWGLAIVLIDYDTLIKEAGLDDLDPAVLISIRGKDALGVKGEVFYGERRVFQDDPELLDINLPFGSWQIAAMPANGWQVEEEPWTPFKTSGTVLSLLFGLVVWMLVRSPFILRAKVESATKEIASSKEQYSAIWENSPIGMQIFDENGRCIMANPAFEVITGYSADEALAGIPDKRILSGQDDPGKRNEREITTKQRELKWVTSTSYPLHTAAGTLMRVSLLSDITEEKLAEKERARFNLIIDQTAETVIIMDPNGTVTYVNPAFEKLSAINRTNIVGKPFSVLCKNLSEIEHCEKILNEARGGQIWRGVLKKYRTNGSSWEENAVVSPVKDSSGELINIVSIGRDVTYERSIEEHLRQSQKIEAVGRLAGGIAHDFNNLLTAINGFAEIISAKIPPSDPLAPDVKEIIKAGEKAATLTRQLLAFSRRQVMQPQVIDLNQVLGDLSKMLRRLIGEHIGLTTVFDKELWRVQADPHQMEQIVINLAVNSRDAMPNGGELTIETANAMLDSSALKDQPGALAGRWVMISVTDSGVGMDEETRSHLFEPFFTTKAKGVGTGLGLATVYGIIKQSGGFIRVHSELGAGTTFRVFLPASTAPEPIERVEETEFVQKKGTETILLAEDDDQVRKFAERLLSTNGYKVIAAVDGVNALEQMKELDCSDIDLLLTDVVMPNMGGVELAKELIEQCPNVKVLYMSGYAASTFADIGLGEQKIKFVQKPFTKETILQQIQETLHGARRSQ